MRMMTISMSSVTLVVLDAVRERWFSNCDHQNSPGCSPACPGFPIHAVCPLSSFSSEFLTLKVLLQDTVQKTWATVPSVPAASVHSWGKPVTAHRSMAVCRVWSQEEVTEGWFPSTKVTPLSSQPEKLKTLPKYPQGGETEARSLRHLVNISPKSGKKQACGWEGNRAVTLLCKAKRNSGICPVRLVNHTPVPDGNPGNDLRSTRGFGKGYINGCLCTRRMHIRAVLLDGSNLQARMALEGERSRKRYPRRLLERHHFHGPKNKQNQRACCRTCICF